MKDLNDILKSALIRNDENPDAAIYQRMMSRQGDTKPKFIDAEATSNFSGQSPYKDTKKSKFDPTRVFIP